MTAVPVPMVSGMSSTHASICATTWTRYFHRIRSSRHIWLRVLKCPQCGHVGEGVEPHVSVRAMTLSLLRFGIGDAEHVKDLERGWAAYRQQNRLDLYGKTAKPAVARRAPCVPSRSSISRRHLQSGSPDPGAFLVPESAEN